MSSKNDLFAKTVTKILHLSRNIIVNSDFSQKNFRDLSKTRLLWKTTV